jgi:hypothetical protein
MKPYYAEYPVDNLNEISLAIENFIVAENIDISKLSGWYFLDVKRLLATSTTLSNFFRSHRLLPRDAAITVSWDSTSLPPHIDEPPVVAKINFPVRNTRGWVNRWYPDGDVNGEVIEYADMTNPVVFNSQILHSVDKISGESPRIVASFTFHNEPGDLLK